MNYLSLLGLLAASCATTASYVWVDDLAPQAGGSNDYQIREGDKLSIEVWNQANLSTQTQVRQDGQVTLPLVGDQPVVGKTTGEAAANIGARLKGMVVQPKVTVAVVEARPSVITVIGEVRTPGLVPLQAGDCVLEVLARAGGLTEFAEDDEIYLLRNTPKPLRVRFDYDRLTNAESRGLAFPLRDGDILVVH